MKTKIYFLFILLYASGCADISRNIFPDNQTCSIAYINDATDTIPQPSVNQILRFYDINDTKKYCGYTLQVTTISDITMVPTKQFEVKPDSDWFNADEPARVQQIKNFQTTFAQWYVATCKPPARPKKCSQVYTTVAHQLNALSDLKNSSQRRIAVVSSDLMEHSEYLNLYAQDFQLAKENPAKVVEYMQKRIPLKDLTGIVVYLVFQPASIEADRRYSVASSLMMSYLTSRHATVYIVAALPDDVQS